MTPRERVLCSLDWREPDRVPVQTYLTPEIHEKLTAHFTGRDVLEALEIDFRTVGPVYRGDVKPSRDGVTYDIWGAGYRRVDHGRGGVYEEAVLLPLAELKTMDDVQAFNISVNECERGAAQFLRAEQGGKSVLAKGCAACADDNDFGREGHESLTDESLLATILTRIFLVGESLGWCF